MRTGSCAAEGCSVEHKPWATSSFGDFLKDNPGWRWVSSNDGSPVVLCPEHAREAVALTSRLMRLVGKYGVSPSLRKAAEKLDTGEYCCEFMEQQLTHSCDTHGEGSKCPDVVIERSCFQGGGGKINLIARNAEYECNFCPRCGRKWMNR